MELTPFTIYLIFTADNIHTVLMALLVISGAATVFALFFGVIEAEPDILKIVKLTGPIALVFALLVAVTPTTKTLVAMYGIPAALDGAKAAATSEVGQKAYSAVNKLLDEYLKSK